MAFCPITKDSCRDDCEWLDVQYKINNDGIERNTCCAVTGIYATLLVALTDDTFEEG